MSGTGFSHIDRRTWAAVCGLGMNPAVAYLACGTGRDNRTTAWCAQAVAQYGVDLEDDVAICQSEDLIARLVGGGHE